MSLQEKEWQTGRPVTSRLSDHIYAVESPYDGVYVRSYLVVGESAALIDTGLKSTGEVILELIESLGSPRVGVAIHTHGHWDHIGSAAEVQEATGCLIAAHIDDAQMLASYTENDRRFLRRFPEFPPSSEDSQVMYNRIGPEVRVDLQLTGGECFSLGRSVVLQVVPMPGHTPGSIGVFEHSSGTLFTGDSLAGRGPFNTLAQYEDVAAYRETIRTAMSLRVRQILPAHGEPIVGEDVKRFLDECMDEVSAIERNVRAEITHGRDLVGVARCVCDRMKKPFMMQPLLTTQAHLEDMEIILPKEKSYE
ncbi:MAG: MBL fold metallo-hydrolase [Armatimonadetes bacterium]|nr:MBL fold metallo-hydrolase [Armatimonadota bacterium]